MRITPTRAIKDECRFCKNGNRFDCESEVCNLNGKTLSALKRIRAHCLTCVGVPSAAKDCSGDVVYPDPHKCHLWAYRFGHDPGRKGCKAVFSHLVAFQKKKGAA